MAAKKEIVLVTGSSGALGQHIVKLLQERDDNVGEIRLFDRKPYVNKLKHAETKKVTEFISDLRSSSDLREAMKGVDCVIHAASVVDMRLMPDIKLMEAINVDGTQAIISACLELNVSRLVFASSTHMVCGTEHIFYGTESTTPIPTTFMIGKYGETKCKAEQAVLEAGGSLCDDRATILKTVSLRSTPIYGEDDKYFFYNFMKYAKKTRNYHYRVRSLDERLQATYVGNAAWAFIKAKDKLAIDASISGEAFFITDDTPIIDIHEVAEPFLKARGFKISQFIVPYWITWIFLSIICFFIKSINTFIQYDVDIPSTHLLNFLCSTFFFNRSKATLRLDYQPIYTPEEAKERSLPYYANVRIL